MVRGGHGYRDGHILLEGTPGNGLIAKFFTSERGEPGGGEVVSVVVDPPGNGYTSGGIATLVYTNPTSGTASTKAMGNTVTDVRRLNFTSLSATPSTYMNRCTAGIVQAPQGQAPGFLASYRVPDSLRGNIGSVCIGSATSNGGCFRRLANHGVGVGSKPQLVVRQTSITSVRVKSGASLRGCGAPVQGSGCPAGLGRLVGSPKGAGGGGGFVACFDGIHSNFTGGGGIHDNITVVSGGWEWEQPPHVWPSDPACRCGTGIHDITFNSGPGGYPRSSGGPLIVVGGTSGSGFLASFTTNDGGFVSGVNVADGGQGYASSPEGSISIVACPSGTTFDPLCGAAGGCKYQGGLSELQTSYPELAILQRDALSGCFAFPLVQISFSFGKAGGGSEAAGNFEECLEAEFDQDQCRCGSGIAEVAMVAEGSGYVDGVLLAKQELKTPDCMCDENTTTVDLDTGNLTAIDCVAWEQMGRPSYCVPAGNGFVGSLFNASSSFPSSNFSVLDPGTGYNESYTSVGVAFASITRYVSFSSPLLFSSLRFLFSVASSSSFPALFPFFYCDPLSSILVSTFLSLPWPTSVTIMIMHASFPTSPFLLPNFEIRCDNGTGIVRSDCMQDGTVTSIVATLQTLDGIPGESVGKLLSDCSGVCTTGSGLNGTCYLDDAGNLEIEIENHGTGYDAPPIIWCENLAEAASTPAPTAHRSFGRRDLSSATIPGPWYELEGTVARGAVFTFKLGNASGIPGSHDGKHNTQKKFSIGAHAYIPACLFHNKHSHKLEQKGVRASACVGARRHGRS